MAIKTVCGFWIGKTQSGRDCLRTTTTKPIELPEGAKLMLLKARDRRSDRAPEYTLIQLVDDEPAASPGPQRDEYTPAPPAQRRPPPEVSQAAVRAANAHDREHMGPDYVPF